MFQTEINHFLQSFASGGLTAFMRFITWLGYEGFLLGFLMIILLAVHFKKGFLMVIIFLWTVAITMFLKEHFDLPRPFHVDNTVQLLDGELPDEATFDFSKRGTTSFWAGLPSDVLEKTRASEGVENGFPSGHSSIAITLWGSLALLFRKRWLTILCASLMVLSPFSRMYLGVHFLADVIGGVTLGGLILGICYWLVLKPDRLSDFVQAKNHQGNKNMTALLVIAPLFLFLFVPVKYYNVLAFLWSFGIGYLLVAHKGLPESDAPILHRIGRTVVGILVFAGVGLVMSKLVELAGLDEYIGVEFVKNVIIGLALMWWSTELNIRLVWFRRENEIVL